MPDSSPSQNAASLPPSGASNTQEARRLAEEVVKRDDTKLTEALLADAIGHLAAEIEAIRSRVETLQRRVNGNLPDPAAWVR